MKSYIQDNRFFIIKVIIKNSHLQSDSSIYMGYQTARAEFDKCASNRNNHIVQMLDADTYKCVCMHIDYED